MAITSQPQRSGFPLTMELAEGRLPKKSWVKISQIRTIPVERLGKRICRVDDGELNMTIEGLLELIA